MSEVVEFKRPEPRGSTLVGEARCIECGCKWAAVAPIGTYWLECPECKSEKGSFRWPVGPRDGEMRWVCNCDCDVFFIIPPGHAVCCHCGVISAKLGEFAR